MEPFFKFSFDGQEIEQSDITQISANASIADDHVFAELFRLPRFVSNVSKGILPYTNGVTIQAYIGAVFVNPFRALIGSTVDAATDTLDNWHGTRSAIVIGTSTSIAQTITIPDNTSSTDSRWDLVYVKIGKDQVIDSVTRYIKSPTTPYGETATTLATLLNTTSEVLTIQGTVGSSTLPSLPSDSGGFYYITLAYVAVPPSFTSSTPLTSNLIFDLAPVLTMSTYATGVSVAKPIDGQFIPGGAIQTSAKMTAWLGGTRPEAYMPPSMVGEETRYIAITTDDVVDGATIDTTLDWRNRVFSWIMQVGSGGPDFAWNTSGVTTSSAVVPSVNSTALATDNTCRSGMGQSFSVDRSAIDPNAAGVLVVDDTTLIAIPSGAIIIFVDMTNGHLRYTANSTTPSVKFFAKITASAQYPNK